MRPEIDAVLSKRHNVATRPALLRAVSRGVLDHEVRTGQLVAPYAGAFCRPWDADLAAVRERAAVLSVGAPVALSRLTALSRWRVLEQERDATVYVTVPNSRYPRRQPGLAVYRVAHLPRIARQDGINVEWLGDAIVSAWPLLAPHDRRGPAIRAVRDGLLTPAALMDALARQPRIRGRAVIAELATLLADGCESELEIWGLLHVFDHPDLRHGRRQKWVSAANRRYRLDLAFEAERVCVELDGRAGHAGEDARERDTRRDAALAAAGWVTLRFTYRRLTTDPAGCRTELLTVLERRRRS